MNESLDFHTQRWQVSFWSRLTSLALRSLVLAAPLAFAGMLLGRILFPNIPTLTLLKTCGTAALGISLIASYLWLRRQLCEASIYLANQGRLVDHNRLELRRGNGQHIQLSTDEISGLVGIGGTPLFGGTLIWKRTLIVTEHAVLRIRLTPEDNEVMFRTVLSQCPYAWGLPFQGELLAPGEVADRTHTNAPLQALGRLKTHLKIVALRMLIVGIGILAIITCLFLYAGARTIWLIVFGLSSGSNILSARSLYQQLAKIEQVEQQLQNLS